MYAIHELNNTNINNRILDITEQDKFKKYPLFLSAAHFPDNEQIKKLYLKHSMNNKIKVFNAG
jgi:hypothetical protein